MKLKHNIQIKNASKEEREEFIKAADKLIETLHNQDFWAIVQANYHTWKYNNGLSYSEFKDLVMSGKNKFEDIADFELDVHVTFYYSRKKVVGYTYPSTWFTWINRRVFSSYDTGDIAGNVAHEDLHNMGFDHPGADRKSLTYQFGYTVRDYINGYKKPVKTKRSFWSKTKSFFRWLF